MQACWWLFDKNFSSSSNRRASVVWCAFPSKRCFAIISFFLIAWAQNVDFLSAQCWLPFQIRRCLGRSLHSVGGTEHRCLTYHPGRLGERWASAHWSAARRCSCCWIHQLESYPCDSCNWGPHRPQSDRTGKGRPAPFTSGSEPTSRNSSALSRRNDQYCWQSCFVECEEEPVCWAGWHWPGVKFSHCWLPAGGTVRVVTPECDLILGWAYSWSLDAYYCSMWPLQSYYCSGDGPERS